MHPSQLLRLLVGFVLQQSVQITDCRFGIFPLRLRRFLAIYSWPTQKHCGIDLSDMLHFGVREPINVLSRQRRPFVLEPLGFDQARYVRQESTDTGGVADTRTVRARLCLATTCRATW